MKIKGKKFGNIYRMIILFSLFLQPLSLLELAAGDFVNLEDAWRMALENNYTLQQQEKLIEQAQQEIGIQRSAYLPEFSSSASYRYQSKLAQLEIPSLNTALQPRSIEAGVSDQYDMALTINQPIFTGFRITNVYRNAQAQFRAQEIRKQEVRNLLLYQIGQLFYNIQANLLQQGVLRESINRAENQLERVRNLLFAQQVTAFDTLEVANRELLLKKQLTKLADINKILVSKLEYLLNQEQLAEIGIMNIHMTNLSLKELEYYQNLALHKRPELRSVQTLKTIQNFGINIIQSSFYPQVFASASFHYARPGVNMFADEWMDYYTFMVSLRWDIWNWKRDTKKVQQAKLNLDNLELKNSELIHDIKQQVKEAYQNLMIVNEQIGLQKTIVDQENERYRITSDRYQQGLVTYLDLSSAEHQLTEAQLELKKDYIAWFQYKLQLDYTTGLIGENLQEVGK